MGWIKGKDERGWPQEIPRLQEVQVNVSFNDNRWHCFECHATFTWNISKRCPRCGSQEVENIA